MSADTKRPERGQPYLALVAGPLTMQLDASSGFLRYLRLGDREVLRGIYVAIRDRNWGTVPPEMHDLRVDQTEDSFRVRFAVRCRQAEIDFRWQGEITGSAGGDVEYRMEGVAQSAFLRNRIGFCVLHGSEVCAGIDCTIEHVDGSRCQATFPTNVAPDQPFRNVRGISHRVLPEITAHLRFEGDTFETEDQRNWTDASFKTYCTPLELPFPVKVPQGTHIQQSVRLTLEASSTARLNRYRVDTLPIEVPIGLEYGPTFRLPPVGLGVASHGEPLSQREQSALSALKLNHLRVDLALAPERVERELLAAAKQARQIGAALHIALALDEDCEEELHRLAETVKATAPPVAAWLLYERRQGSTSGRVFQTARFLLGPVAPEATFAVGTNANFAELNRGRPSAGLADWICYSINPQVHAFDDDSLVETLEAQRDTVTSARSFAGKSRIAVSPITLKPRFNAVATGLEPDLPADQLPSQVDPRQATLFAAGWTLGSIAALASGGVESLTYYETTGWRGVMELEEGCPLPAEFPSKPGCVFPVYHLLADLAGRTGCECRSLVAEVPRKIYGMVSSRSHGGTLWLANLTSQPQSVTLPEEVLLQGSARIRLLDKGSLAEAMTSPRTSRARAFVPLVVNRLLLSSHALARIDYGEQD